MEAVVQPVSATGSSTNSALKKGFIIGALILFGSVIAYAAYSIKKQVGLVKNMKVGFAGIEALDFNLSNVILKIKLSIQNVSDITVQTKTIRIDVFVNNQRLGDSPTVFQSYAQTLKPRTTSIVEFQVSFNPITTITGIASTPDAVLKLLDFKSINIKLDGYISGSADGVSFENIPIQLDGNVGDLMGLPKTPTTPKA